MTRTASLALCASLTIAAGCLVEPADAVDPGTDPGDPGDPGPGSDPEPGTPGAYGVVTTFDLTAGVIAPAPIHDAVGLLIDFRDEPAATLVAVLDGAGVPLLADLLDVLPGPVEGELLGWIDEHIDGALAASGAGQWIDEVVALSETALARFDAVSDLSLGDGAPSGPADATHRIRGVAFALSGQAVHVDVPAVAGVTAVAATAELSPAGDAVALAVGDHAFGLAYGELVYGAIDAWMRDTRGQDLRGALGAAVSCPALASSVASRCVLGVCVGHEAELEAICETGLDLVTAEIRARMAALRFDALRLHAGQAALRDTDGDGATDALTGGVWTAEIDAGMGPRSIPARFEGVRLP